MIKDWRINLNSRLISVHFLLTPDLITLSALPRYRYQTVNAKSSKGTSEDPNLIKTILVHQALKGRLGKTNFNFTLENQEIS